MERNRGDMDTALGDHTMSTGRSDFVSTGGHGVCLHQDRWDEVRAALRRIEDKVDKLDGDHDDLHHKMFEGNGKPAIIPTLELRVASLEREIVPRDDVRDMVSAFKVGRTIIMAIATVAAVGFAGIAFWHFFKRA